MNVRLMLFHALSPVHCGTGQAVGGIDLPIAREKSTGLPLIPGSSIKGVLRAGPVDDASRATHVAVFGPETENASDNAGSVHFSDASLLFLPMRSLRGTFAWVTSPFLLGRFLRDAREAGLELGSSPTLDDERVARVTGSRLVAVQPGRRRVILEDLDFDPREDERLRTLAGGLAGLVYGADEGGAEDRAFFAERVCVVHDDVMSMLAQAGTEVVARVRLGADSKTVEKGALWTEEALPSESILAGLVVAAPVRQKGGGVPEGGTLLEHVRKMCGTGLVQLGGKATVGRGLCRVRMGG